MTPAPTQRPHSRGRNIAWMVLVVAMAAYGVAGVVAGVYALFTSEPWLLVRTSLGVVVAYWFGVGAWRRTSWGDTT